jgi:hypothetical protein
VIKSVAKGSAKYSESVSGGVQGRSWAAKGGELVTLFAVEADHMVCNVGRVVRGIEIYSGCKGYYGRCCAMDGPRMWRDDAVVCGAVDYVAAGLLWPAAASCGFQWGWGELGPSPLRNCDWFRVSSVLLIQYIHYLEICYLFPSIVGNLPLID